MWCSGEVWRAWKWVCVPGFWSGMDLRSVSRLKTVHGRVWKAPQTSPSSHGRGIAAIRGPPAHRPDALPPLTRQANAPESRGPPDARNAVTVGCRMRERQREDVSRQKARPLFSPTGEKVPEGRMRGARRQPRQTDSCRAAPRPPLTLNPLPGRGEAVPRREGGREALASGELQQFIPSQTAVAYP
jgi:hypothetical protein